MATKSMTFEVDFNVNEEDLKKEVKKYEKALSGKGGSSTMGGGSGGGVTKSLDKTLATVASLGFVTAAIVGGFKLATAAAKRATETFVSIQETAMQMNRAAESLFMTPLELEKSLKALNEVGIDTETANGLLTQSQSLQGSGQLRSDEIWNDRGEELSPAQTLSKILENLAELPDAIALGRAKDLFGGFAFRAINASNRLEEGVGKNGDNTLGAVIARQVGAVGYTTAGSIQLQKDRAELNANSAVISSLGDAGVASALTKNLIQPYTALRDTYGITALDSNASLKTGVIGGITAETTFAEMMDESNKLATEILGPALKGMTDKLQAILDFLKSGGISESHDKAVQTMVKQNQDPNTPTYMNGFNGGTAGLPSSNPYFGPGGFGLVPGR